MNTSSHRDAPSAHAVTIRRGFLRPPAADVARLAATPTGYVVDARGRRGALHPGIRPLLEAPRFAGTALPVATVARDNLVPYAALREAEPGDVLVIRTGDHDGAAVIGDLLAGMARNCGIVAIVTDGRVRDIEGLEAVGLPCFARGLTPNSPEKNGPGTIGLPVSVGGEVIDAGDVVVGDRDGVVVVPRAEVDAVLAALDGIRAKEAAVEQAIAGGAKWPGWLEATLETKGVRIVE